MGKKGDFVEDVHALAQEEGKYAVQAYFFVFEALEFTLKRLKKRRHVTGRELVSSIKEFALANFGAMGKVVFNQWGVKDTGDFGRIVFSLVDAGLMSKTEQDSLEDFADGFDFEQVFESSYTTSDLPELGSPPDGKSPESA